MIKESDLLNKIKIKLKSKAVTTLQSKDNSKTNICEELLNSSTKNSKQTYTSSNTNLNNNFIHNTNKIYINNIINVNTNNENLNNINNNCGSYRVMEPDKIQSYKHQLINVPSRTPCFEYSFSNKSQKNIMKKQINKSNPNVKEVSVQALQNFFQ